MLNSGQNWRLFVPCDLGIWRMSLKTIGHLFYATLSVAHFKAIDEFKLELQSENAQFGSESTIFCSVWPWNLMDDLPSKKKRLPLLCCFKLCATFHSHQWIQAGVRVRKRPIWFNIDDSFSRVTLKFDEWHWKTIGYLCWATSSFMHHFIIVCEWVTVLKRLSRVLTSVTLTFDLWPWPFAWTSLLSLVTTPENFMIMGKGVTDGGTDGQTHRMNHSYSCLVAAKYIYNQTTGRENSVARAVTGKQQISYLP